jgi:hypothetical protein
VMTMLPSLIRKTLTFQFSIDGCNIAIFCRVKAQLSRGEVEFGISGIS